MGKLAGLALIAAGVATAAYVYPLLGPGADRPGQQRADVVAMTTGAIPAGQPIAPRPPTVVVRPAGQDTQRVVSAETTPGRLPLATQTGKPPTIAAVLAAPIIEQPMAKPIDVPQPSSTRRTSRGDDESKIALTRDIQRELKRVGCYEGAVDGTWTPETRQGMKQFIDRVNASLPVDEADHILKTLVQGHPGNACGKSCPTGQAMTADNKCLPAAIIAAPRRAPQPVPLTRDAAAQPATKASSWEPKVVQAPVPFPMPVPKSQAAASPEPRAVDAKTADAKIEPLPGRNSLGAAGVPTQTTAPVLPEVLEPRAKRPVVVVKPRVPVENQTDTVIAALPQPAPKAGPLAPTIGAVAAIEAPEAPRARPSPPPPVVFRAPAQQRYVSTYSPPPVYRERPRFGPQIFRELERNGR